MLYRLAIAAALGLAALTAPADAQTAQVLPSCGSASIPVGPGGRLYVDQTGNLCTAGGGGGGGGTVTQGTSPWVISGNSTANGSGNPIFVQFTNPLATGSVTAGGTSGTQAQAVQGIAGGVAQNVNVVNPNPVGAFYTTDPNYSATSPSYIALDKRARLKAAETGSDDATVGIAPAITQSGTTVVGKASQGNLYSAYALNTTATAGYLACINATAAPAGGAAITPIDVQTLAGTVGATASINYGAGPPNAYSTGIVCLITTSLTTYTAGGASFIQARVR